MGVNGLALIAVKNWPNEVNAKLSIWYLKCWHTLCLVGVSCGSQWKVFLTPRGTLSREKVE